MLAVHKNDLIKGKHIVNSNLDENGDLSSINEDELSKQALASKEIPLQPSGNKKTPAYRRSPFNIFLNIRMRQTCISKSIISVEWIAVFS